MAWSNDPEWDDVARCEYPTCDREVGVVANFVCGGAAHLKGESIGCGGAYCDRHLYFASSVHKYAVCDDCLACEEAAKMSEEQIAALLAEEALMDYLEDPDAEYREMMENPYG